MSDEPLELLWGPDDEEEGCVLFPDPGNPDFADFGAIDMGGFTAEPATAPVETEEQRNARIWAEIVKASTT